VAAGQCVPINVILRVRSRVTYLGSYECLELYLRSVERVIAVFSLYLEYVGGGAVIVIQASPLFSSHPPPLSSAGKR
jgi:hypothetical protein